MHEGLTPEKKNFPQFSLDFSSATGGDGCGPVLPGSGTGQEKKPA